MAGYAKSLIEKWTALYVRLSRDDDNEGDSNSISHQVEILTKYAKEHGIENFKIYKDDGFSGTNFNRPGFQEMMGDIENGLVSMVVVKDMSRFGRNYLEVGMYTEIRFPEMGVRFIAVNDGVDSEREDNDFTPFRNIINEWYAKDTSKKIRAVFRNKGMSGQRISTQTPYGYLRNEDGNLYVDEETAPNVRLIFQLCAEGNGPGKIARMLKEQVIPTPGTLEFQRTGRTRWYRPDDPCRWTPDTVAGILEQDSYLGRTSNFKFSRVSYKSKKKVENPPEKWVTFENTHEAIIDVELWNAVQKIRSQRRRPTKMGEMGMFSGLTYCADCGAKLYHCRTGSWTYEQECYNCSTQKSHKGCFGHYIRAVVLEQLVLQNLQRVIAYVQEDENEFAQLVMRNQTAAQEAEQMQTRRLLEKNTPNFLLCSFALLSPCGCKALEPMGTQSRTGTKNMRRMNELDTIIQRLYEDNISGKLTDERFKKLSEAYEQEQAALRESVPALAAQLQDMDDKMINVQHFLKAVRKYTQPEKLTAAMLRELVEKVVVYAPDKSSGHRVQRIDVYYTFIGKIDFSPEYSKKGTA